MFIQIQTATPHQLNYLVALIESHDVAPFAPNQKVLVRLYDHENYVPFLPSTDPRDGSPLIERERISIIYRGNPNSDTAEWRAITADGKSYSTGNTALIAGIRYFVATHFGETAEVPDEL